MAGVATQFTPRDLLIHTPDGKTRTLPLDRERFTLGRSSTNELCYSEDAGLSRQHMVLEKTGGTWTVRDLNSKGGDRWVYYVELDMVRPDFTVRCDPDKAMVGPGSSTATPSNCEP